MSTLWTPSGEHPVPRKPTGPEPGGVAPGRTGPPPGAAGGAGQRHGQAGPPGAAGGGRGEAGPGRGRGAGTDPGEQSWEPTPEEIEEAQAEMDAVRAELVRAPAELVISNHAMGLWELAALHLSQKPPQLPQAQLAIDALSALVEGLHGRLGEAERTLRDGLAEIRMAFVQIAGAERTRQGSPAGRAPGTAG